MLNNKTIHLSGLNGLRAIAALAVVVCHITMALGNFNLDPSVLSSRPDGALPLAIYGVSIFFVLSGFLITYLLQSERDVQKINIKKFYIRRILRIWPLYYLCLVITLIIMFLFALEVDMKMLFCYLFFAANIPYILKNDGIPLLYHYWSLGVEEQFYLFWPWFNKIKKNLVTIIVGLIVVLLLTKGLLHYLMPGTLLESVLRVTRFHNMMIGALGAILYKQRSSLFMLLTNNKLTQLLCWGILLLVAVNKFHFISVIDNEIVCVVALCIIIGQAEKRNRLVNLDTGVFNFLGKISYGMYVYHPLMIFLFSRILNEFGFEGASKYFLVYLVITGSTILISHLSYKYFEKYFLNLKKRFVVIESAATIERSDKSNIENMMNQDQSKAPSTIIAN